MTPKVPNTKPATAAERPLLMASPPYLLTNLLPYLPFKLIEPHALPGKQFLSRHRKIAPQRAIDLRKTSNAA
jgi:hypothetical protein